MPSGIPSFPPPLLRIRNQHLPSPRGRIVVSSCSVASATASSHSMDIVVYSCAKLFPIKTINCQPSSDGNLQQCAGLFKHGIQTFPPFLLFSSGVRPARCVELFRRVRDGSIPSAWILLFLVVLSCFQFNRQLPAELGWQSPAVCPGFSSTGFRHSFLSSFSPQECDQIVVSSCSAASAAASLLRYCCL